MYIQKQKYWLDKTVNTCMQVTIQHHGNLKPCLQLYIYTKWILDLIINFDEIYIFIQFHIYTISSWNSQLEWAAEEN